MLRGSVQMLGLALLYLPSMDLQSKAAATLDLTVTLLCLQSRSLLVALSLWLESHAALPFSNHPLVLGQRGETTRLSIMFSLHLFF